MKQLYQGIPKLISDLSKEFWGGRRWILDYNQGKTIKLKLFSNYAVADHFANECKEVCPSISVLSAVIKCYHKPIPPIVQDRDCSNIGLLLSNCGLQLPLTREYSILELAKGNIVPFWIIRSRNPISNANFVIEKHYEKNSSRKSAILKTTDAFIDAMRAFELHSQENSRRAEVHIKMSSISYRQNLITTLYDSHLGETTQVNDPCEPIEQKQPIFAKYKQSTNFLEFYNGSLKRIQPYNMLEEFSFNHLSVNTDETLWRILQSS